MPSGILGRLRKPSQQPLKCSECHSWADPMSKSVQQKLDYDWVKKYGMCKTCIDEEIKFQEMQLSYQYDEQPQMEELP